MKLYYFVLTLLFSFPLATAYSQTDHPLSLIVEKIREIDFVYYEAMGRPSEIFEKLKKTATIPQLIDLTNDNNRVVAYYAGSALIDKSYNDLPSILIRFLNEDKIIHSQTGCVGYSQLLSSEFYYKYYNSISGNKSYRSIDWISRSEDTIVKTDKTLFTMDSIILYKDFCNELLTKTALENRVYPENFIKRIEYLAFTELNRDAIIYLKKVNQKVYEEPIKQKEATLKYFEENFPKVSYPNLLEGGAVEYFRTLMDLLNYQDGVLKPLIIKEFKFGTVWYNWSEKDTLFKIFEKHNIRLKDLNNCFSHTGTIKGRILGYDQKGLYNASFYLRGQKTCPYDIITSSDMDGNFVMKNIPIGTYELLITGYPKYLDLTLTSIKVSNDTITNLHIDNLPPCKYYINRDIDDNTCPVCKKKDQVIPIDYGIHSRKDFVKTKKGEVKVGRDWTVCHPTWYCKFDKKEF